MRITDFPELVTATGNDLLVTVDIANDLTKKIKLENLPTSIATTVALATKQNLLVSGTNIKTVNSTTLLGSGDIAVQPTLVSGTNIKTLNSVSLLGSGDIVVGATPSGVAGAIQFSNGSAFASDASNLFWDDTNNRLGVGTNAPNTALDISASLTSIFTLRNGATNFITTRSSGISGVDTGFRIWDNANNFTLDLYGSGSYDHAQRHRFYVGGAANERLLIGATTAATIKGSGSTSATTSLLVQNSAGTMALSVKDNLETEFGGATTFNTLMAMRSGSFLFEASNAGYLMNANGLRFGNSIGLLFGSAGANSGSPDTGFNRSSAGTLKVTNGSTGYGSIDTSLYKVSGTNGFTGTGSYTNFTIVGGIITNAS